MNYYEIYNEKVSDLLAVPSGNTKKSWGEKSTAVTSLTVREHKKKGVYIEGLTHKIVTNYDEVRKLLAHGNKLRTVAATGMNSRSSRSHAIFMMNFRQTDADGNAKNSQICLVDLAGSERTKDTMMKTRDGTKGAAGGRMRETATINKSLSALGLVINQLAEKKTAKFVG